MVAKEQQRKILLYSAAPKTPAAKKPAAKTPAAKTPPASKSTAKAKKKIQKGGRGGKKDVEKAGETSGDGEVGVAGKGSAGGKAGRKKKTAGRKNDANPTQREIAVAQTALAECECSIKPFKADNKTCDNQRACFSSSNCSVFLSSLR